jgi:hypothetical protein
MASGGKGLLAGSFLVRAAALGLVILASAAPVARSWSKEGHMMTCQIAQVTHLARFAPPLSSVKTVS